MTEAAATYVTPSISGFLGLTSPEKKSISSNLSAQPPPAEASNESPGLDRYRLIQWSVTQPLLMTVEMDTQTHATESDAFLAVFKMAA
ncbi:hypothetical protein Pmani_015922 [Petrolisthes manimaculis]|uniref:Uncharacterized protein n=1 Tax=Petrolisthes manimaculis TaxID=1843537 RepID=A0AAE1PSW4_9EUCA|nr:hypothetical protein Pmani_015922 [Petrolisthes manimaculis]